jgi:hypothetical protein
LHSLSNNNSSSSSNILEDLPITKLEKKTTKEEKLLLFSGKFVVFCINFIAGVDCFLLFNVGILLALVVS